MTRFSRISTIWRKELVDTLRDRRTLVAMVLVPMVLYPALMLGSLQAFEYQTSQLQRERYRIAVTNESEQRWLEFLIQTDAARRPGAEGRSAEELIEAESQPASAPNSAESPPPARGDTDHGAVERARRRAHEVPPEYEVVIVKGDVQAYVRDGFANVGVGVNGELPQLTGAHTAMPEIIVVFDQSNPRSGIALDGLRGVLGRAADQMIRERLAARGLDLSFIRPIAVNEFNVAPPERVTGAIIGQIVPLILIIMTITGAIYPAIDLTAGERERGTLETLMVAPVPTVDLIAGKFVVVALIGMLSAVLNLLSIGGTIYFGGLGSALTQGREIVIPLRALPLVLMVLIPLAIMFSAMLLAVCSFARSFKEAQNYVMPVMIAALIPAVVGTLPGVRLAGPILIMPVANIVVLTRDLFTDHIDPIAIMWVLLSTSTYAAAAVAIAAKLFGQEAVLFADSASIKTLFQRRFFKPTDTPNVAQAFLLLAIIFSLNFFLQQALGRTPGLMASFNYIVYGSIILVVLYGILPFAAAAYARTRFSTTFLFSSPPLISLLAAFLLGSSTWVLARAWLVIQQDLLPALPQMEEVSRPLMAAIGSAPLALVILLLAVTPAICEELFFRGYALTGLKKGLGPIAAALIVALAFGVHHHSAQRLIVTCSLGLVLCVLAIRSGSIWPSMIAHMMHNGLSIAADSDDGLRPLLSSLGFFTSESPPMPWLLGAIAAATLGVLLASVARTRPPAVAASAVRG